MNARDIPAALADIGTEARRLAQGHGSHYDAEIVMRSGHVHHSSMLRYLPERDAHMARVLAWLRKSGRARDVESITLRPLGSGVEYVYVVRGGE